MRRKPGTLLPLEIAILEVAASRHEAIHGFALARALADGRGSRTLTAHGTLYKALGRLTAQGLLTAEWEDPALAEQDGRPRRRLYRITADGARRLAATHADAAPAHPAVRPA